MEKSANEKIWKLRSELCELETRKKEIEWEIELAKRELWKLEKLAA